LTFGVVLIVIWLGLEEKCAESVKDPKSENKKTEHSLYTFNKHNYVSQNNENEISGDCRKHGRHEKHTHNISRIILRRKTTWNTHTQIRG
jgi:hypothetical protein